MSRRLDLYDPYVIRKSAHPADVRRYAVIDMKKICPVYICNGYGGAELYMRSLGDPVRYMVTAYNGRYCGLVGVGGKKWWEALQV